jgi:hypothetical protein
MFVHIIFFALFLKNSKTRYKLIKTIKQLWIPLEQQPNKFIEDFPITNHIMHFPTENHEKTRGAIMVIGATATHLCNYFWGILLEYSQIFFKKSL